VIEGIVPRWEWRTFGQRFGDAVNRLATEPAQESDELYVLGLESEASAKVREGVMDVKRLEEVDDDGLEQWRPVMKASFPMPEAEVVAMLEALGAAAGELARAAYTHEEIPAELVAPRAGLLAVPVHKRRARFTVGGCMAELSEFRTDHGATQTVAVESEQPHRDQRAT
jgi:exopolyphosphatase / guanosine-5'-triphosphate,3'-diphosphate pyrophosphatase